MQDGMLNRTLMYGKHTTLHGIPDPDNSLPSYTRERYDLPKLSPVYARGRQLIWKIFSLAGITSLQEVHENV